MKLKYYLRGLGLGIIVTTIIMAISFGNKNTDIPDAEIISRAEKLGMEMKSRKVINNEEILASEMEKQKKNSQSATENSSKEDNKSTEKTGQGADKSTEKNAQGTGASTEKASQKTDKSTEKASQGTDGSAEKTAQGTGSSTEKTSQGTNGSAEKNAKGANKSEKNSTQKDNKSAEKSSQKPAGEASRDTKTVRLTVGEGDGCRQVAEKLKNMGVIKDSEEFRNYMSSQGLDDNILTGTFTIPKGATYRELGEILTK